MPPVIKAAYRAAVQTAHLTAAAIPPPSSSWSGLRSPLDPEARLYDEGGIVDEEAVKAFRRDVAKILADMFDAAVSTAVATGLDLKRVDFVQQMTQAVRTGMADARAGLQRADRDIAALTALGARITRKGEGRNIFGERLGAQVAARAEEQASLRRRVLSWKPPSSSSATTRARSSSFRPRRSRSAQAKYSQRSVEPCVARSSGQQAGAFARPHVRRIFDAQVLIAALAAALATPALAETASLHGLDMHCAVHGEGPPLVRLHGAYGSAADWAGLVPTLTQTHQVIALDFQAHGRTSDRDTPITYEGLADDVAALLDHLKIESATVFGYSMGGGVALQVAVRHPEKVDRLVAASASIAYDAFPDAFKPMIETLTPEFFAGTILETSYLGYGRSKEEFANLVSAARARSRRVHLARPDTPPSMCRRS